MTTTQNQPAMQRPSPANDFQCEHAELLLTSYQLLLRQPLLKPQPSSAAAARALFQSTRIVVSHDTKSDPVLTYGNEAALRLWETDWDTLVQMPSRLTAEPVHQDERARLLREVDAHGFINNYAGIRITATGRRFKIENAIIWNLMCKQGRLMGQAATFETVCFL